MQSAGQQVLGLEQEENKGTRPKRSTSIAKISNDSVEARKSQIIRNEIRQ